MLAVVQVPFRPSRREATDLGSQALLQGGFSPPQTESPELTGSCFCPPRRLLKPNLSPPSSSVPSVPRAPTFPFSPTLSIGPTRSWASGFEVTPRSFTTLCGLLLALRSLLRSRSTPCTQVGTVALGRCLDAKLKPHGTEGLRVCDASIFPEQLSGHPVSPSVVSPAGESLADSTRASRWPPSLPSPRRRPTSSRPSGPRRARDGKDWVPYGRVQDLIWCNVSFLREPRTNAGMTGQMHQLRSRVWSTASDCQPLQVNVGLRTQPMDRANKLLSRGHSNKSMSRSRPTCSKFPRAEPFSWTAPMPHGWPMTCH